MDLFMPGTKDSPARWEINTLRKDFDAPFVIATIGFDGWKMSGPHKTVADPTHQRKQSQVEVKTTQQQGFGKPG